jgi:hypothetical protein
MPQASWLDPEKPLFSCATQIDSRGVAHWRDAVALLPMITTPEYFERYAIGGGRGGGG